MSKKVKSIMGHHANILDEEARRLIKLYKEILGIEINFTEATAIVSKRSEFTQWPNKKLKDEITRLRL